MYDEDELLRFDAHVSSLSTKDREAGFINPLPAALDPAEEACWPEVRSPPSARCRQSGTDGEASSSVLCLFGGGCNAEEEDESLARRSGLAMTVSSDYAGFNRSMIRWVTLQSLPRRIRKMEVMVVESRAAYSLLSLMSSAGSSDLHH